jgi:hypothetical protein
MKGIIVVVTIIGLLFGFTVGTVYQDGEAYKRGQLDYQKGIVKYELLENGYKKIFSEDE